MRLLAPLLCFASAVAALPTYTRTQAPKGWILGDRASPSSTVSFIAALKQRNLDVLSSTFDSVSNPRSNSYRHFLTSDEILSIVSPTEEDRNTVLTWLHRNRVTNIRDLGDAFECETSVADAELLFRTFFHTYTSTEDNSVSLVRTFGTYSVDDDVAPLIDMVTGIASFPVPHYRTQRPFAVDLEQGVAPQTLQALYGVPSKLQLSTNTSQGVIEFQGESFSPSDLELYGIQTNIKIPAVSANHTIGPNTPQRPFPEGTLDVDMMMALNPEAVNWYWLEDGNGWMYAFATHLFSTHDVPQVVSISYGWSESDQCFINPNECQQMGVTPIEYVNRVNTEFQKIGLRGVTLLAASGDDGANGKEPPRHHCEKEQLFPDFPASSPYVTSVGATELVQPVYNLKNAPPICLGKYKCPSGGYEQAVSYNFSFYCSGGGFSSVAQQPSYQVDVVSRYLKSGVTLPPATYYNASGRAYPDVAAIGHNNLVVYGNVVSLESGTSASAPIWGAIISLLNQAAVAKDGKPLGFVNPLLYQIAAELPTAFFDITVGDNKCFEGGYADQCEGFLATPGWDPVTGLGSPNFPLLLQYVRDNL